MRLADYSDFLRSSAIIRRASAKTSSESRTLPASTSATLIARSCSKAALSSVWACSLSFMASPFVQMIHMKRGLSVMFQNSFFYGVIHPVIEAHSLTGGCMRCFLVQFRGNSHIKTPRVGFFGSFAFLRTKIQVVFHRISQSCFQLINGTPLKRNHIVNMQHVTVKNIGFRVVLKTPLIAFISKYAHGFTPAFSRKRLTDFTAPLSVTGCGCGRWNVARTLFNSTRTREPRPSLISAPQAVNRLSISTHAIDGLTGLANIATSVLRCLLFMVK